MSSGSVLQKDWHDFNSFIYSWIPKYTIPTLKLFAETFASKTQQVSVGLRSNERKSDIISKLQTAFLTLKARGDLDTYAKIRLRLEEIAPGSRGWYYQPPDPAPAPTFGGVSYLGRPGGSSNAGLYGSGSGSLYGGAGSSGAGASANGIPPRPSYNPSHTLVDWKPNPMWKPIKALTPMEYVPEVSVNDSSSTRRCKKATFVLSTDVIQKLEQTRANPNAKPRYSVRIFAASSDHYYPPQHNPHRTNLNVRVPIEFPNNPDVMVDYSQSYHFKEKGLRGKAGSAPPFEVERAGKLSLQPGRLSSVTFGQTGPTVAKRKEYAKRFWFQVVLAEMTTKEDLLERVNALLPTSAEDSMREFKKRQDAEDDIMVGTSVMSIKDPLSYMRISRPVRSSKCSHVQCFDPQWWIESNAAHPQWLCPHCNKELNFDDLIVDGYVQSILDAVPDSVDDVVLEPSGEWHTEDNKYGSAGWFAENPSLKPASAAAGASTSAAPSPPPESKPSFGSLRSPSQADGSTSNGKRKVVEILSSDDDEPDEPLAKTNGTSSRFSGGIPSSRNSSAPQSSAVIDLTLSDSDDDEDDAQPRAPAGAGFRGPGPVSDRVAFDSTRPPSASHASTQKEDAVVRQANGGGRGEGSSTGTGTLAGAGAGAGAGGSGSGSGAAPAAAAAGSAAGSVPAPAPRVDVPARPPSTDSNSAANTNTTSPSARALALTSSLERIRSYGSLPRLGGKSPALATPLASNSPASRPSTPLRPSSSSSNPAPGTPSSSTSAAAAPAARPVPSPRAAPPNTLSNFPRFRDFPVQSPSASPGTGTSTPGLGAFGNLAVAQAAGGSGSASASASGSGSAAGGGSGTASEPKKQGSGFAEHASNSNPWSPRSSKFKSDVGTGGGANILGSVPSPSSKAAPAGTGGGSSDQVRGEVRRSLTAGETATPAPAAPAPAPAPAAAASRSMWRTDSEEDRLPIPSSDMDLDLDVSMEEGEVAEEEEQRDSREAVNGRVALDRQVEERFWQGVMDGEIDDLYTQ
ncbi:hypothetical protein IAT38_004647 [Cryptococcus sp. DSM 104549]